MYFLVLKKLHENAEKGTINYTIYYIKCLQIISRGFLIPVKSLPSTHVPFQRPWLEMCHRLNWEENLMELFSLLWSTTKVNVCFDFREGSILSYLKTKWKKLLWISGKHNRNALKIFEVLIWTNKESWIFTNFLK